MQVTKVVMDTLVLKKFFCLISAGIFTLASFGVALAATNSPSHSSSSTNSQVPSVMELLALPQSSAAGLKANGSTVAPDPSANPVLASLIASGITLYYLGNRSGIDGWMLVKDGQFQIAYDVPGTKEAIVGAMFGPGGENVTGSQAEKVFRENPQILAAMKQRQTGIPSVMPSPFAGVDVATNPAPAPSTAPGNTTPELTLGDRLLMDMQAASGVTLGNNAQAPVIQMIMDPNCPHCQATWHVLHDAVMKNIIRLHMIPVSPTPDSDDERAGAVLLHAADPLNAWDKYANGDKAPLAGPANATDLTAIRSNRTIVDNWRIDATPYFAYRSKTGQVKIIKGEIKQADTLLSDVVP